MTSSGHWKEENRQGGCFHTLGGSAEEEGTSVVGSSLQVVLHNIIACINDGEKKSYLKSISI